MGTVKSRVSRARDKIALILAEGSFEKDGQPANNAMADILAQLRHASHGAPIAA